MTSELGFWTSSILTLVPSIASYFSHDWIEIWSAIICTVIITNDSFGYLELQDRNFLDSLVNSVQTSAGSLVFIFVGTIATIFSGNYRTLALSTIGFVLIVASNITIIYSSFEMGLFVLAFKNSVKTISIMAFLASMLKIPLQYRNLQIKIFGVPIVRICNNFTCKFDMPFKLTSFNSKEKQSQKDRKE